MNVTTFSNIPVKRQILLFFTKSHWQFFLALLITLFLFFHIQAWSFDTKNIKAIVEFSVFLGFMAAIMSVLALSGSIAFGYMLQYMSAANSDRKRVYSGLQDYLFKFGDFVDRLEEDDTSGKRNDLVKNSRKVIYWMSKHTLQDFPIKGWDVVNVDLIKSTEGYWDGAIGEEQNNKVLMHLKRIEELITEIATVSIRQIWVHIFVRPVIKIFVVLVISILLTLTAYIFSGIPRQLLINVGPPFVSILTILFFYELGFSLRQEVKATLDFVQYEKE